MTHFSDMNHNAPHFGETMAIVCQDAAKHRAETGAPLMHVADAWALAAVYWEHAAACSMGRGRRARYEAAASRCADEAAYLQEQAKKGAK